MPTYRGNNSDNVVYQDEYGTDLTVYAYGGNDSIYLNLTGQDGGYNTVYGDSGNDLVDNQYEGGNRIDLGSGNDTYLSSGFSTSSKLYDVVYAGSGNDKLDVATYHSDYYGEEGNDAFFSVGFNNYFNGGSGSDTISYEGQDDDPDLAGRGMVIDLQEGYAATRGTRYEEILVSIESVIGTGTDDRIYGSSALNKLWGDGGDDVIDGRGGNDRIYGGDGDDDLYGSTGNDFLIGDAGTDWLYGESGADRFVFRNVSDSLPNSGRDVIKDFDPDENDLIDLRSIDADTSIGGNQSFNFIGASDFTGQAGELRFTPNGILSADVDGDGLAEFHVKVQGFTKMYESDFLL